MLGVRRDEQSLAVGTLPRAWLEPPRVGKLDHPALLWQLAAQGYWPATSAAHAEAIALAGLAILLYPVGLLALNAVLLLCARRAILSGRPTALSSAIAFLYREYKPHMFVSLTPGRKLPLYGCCSTL